MIVDRPKIKSLQKNRSGVDRNQRLTSDKKLDHDFGKINQVDVSES